MAQIDSVKDDAGLYQVGSKGVGVEVLQTLLKNVGHYKGEINGDFDPVTEEGVKAFQEESDLVADGIVGVKTWQRLFAVAEDGAYTFEQVLERELIEINISRGTRLKTRPTLPIGKDVVAEAHTRRLLGLAFSGGGIRSATFNLGVLQALAELRLLRRVDYLSTVSGGGYIGSWLAAWARRERSILKVEQDLSLRKTDETEGQEHQAPKAGQSPEPKPLRFLRSYSNYITPKKGLFSSDTWSVVSTYLRNLTLNLTVIIAAFITLLLIPRLLVWAAQSYISSRTLVLGVSGFLLLVSLGFIALNLDALLEATPTKRRHGDYRQQLWVRITIVWPSVVAALCLSYLLWCDRGVLEEGWLTWAIGGMIAYSGLWLLAWIAGRLLDRVIAASSNLSSAHRSDHGTDPTSHSVHHPPGSTRRTDLSAKTSFSILAPALLIGAVAGPLFRILGNLLDIGWGTRLALRHLSQLISWGPPSIIMLFSLIVTLHIGLMGRAYPEKMQEWWSRLGGHLMIIAMVWTGWFTIAIYGPVIVEWLWARVWVTSAVSSGWLLVTIAGLLIGRSPLTGAPGSKREVEIVAKAAPYVFTIGLFLLLSSLTAVALNHIIEAGQKPNAVLYVQSLDAASRYFTLMEWTARSDLLLLLFLCVGLTVLFAWRVDINQFSMHLLYRNRLARCYLGASNANRKPQPFTGFDPHDDFPLNDLALTRLEGSSYGGPYPIINTALNLVTGRQLAWQERKAASFVFTPQFCGYEMPAEEDTRQIGESEQNSALKPAYRSTATYAIDGGGVSLGTAMAISGAAASPNMGYHSSPALAFLMTIFNIRLGWWLGNTRDLRKKKAESRGMSIASSIRAASRRLPNAFLQPWKKSGPRFGFYCLLAELLGFSSSDSKYIYLSDGGHFDNLGLYELVRRRCHHIIACDVSQDRDFTFDDLGRTIRRCYADFGIEIEIDIEPIKPRKGNASSEWHCAVGTIHYENVDRGASPGTLIYLKPSFTGDEPADLLSYQATAPKFPHESTVDQWFDESQFESYRKLGHHIAMSTFDSSVAEVAQMQETLHKPSSQGDVPSVAGEMTPVPDATTVPGEEALFQALRRRWCSADPSCRNPSTESDAGASQTGPMERK